MYAVVAVVMGMVIGLVTGGRFRNIGRRTFRATPLLGIGVVLQVLTEAVHVPHRADEVAVLASYVALAAFAAANLQLGGMGVVAVGLLLNIVPIAVNQGMPVRQSAILRARIVSRPDQVARLGFGGKRHLERSGDRLDILGDILPDRFFHEVLSFGDLVMSVGIAAVCANLLRPSRRRRPARRVVAAAPDPPLTTSVSPDPPAAVGRYEPSGLVGSAVGAGDPQALPAVPRRRRGP